jgi:hypothetical protein
MTASPPPTTGAADSRRVREQRPAVSDAAARGNQQQPQRDHSSHARLAEPRRPHRRRSGLKTQTVHRLLNAGFDQSGRRSRALRAHVAAHPARERSQAAPDPHPADLQPAERHAAVQADRYVSPQSCARPRRHPRRPETKPTRPPGSPQTSRRPPTAAPGNTDRQRKLAAARDSPLRRVAVDARLRNVNRHPAAHKPRRRPLNDADALYRAASLNSTVLRASSRSRPCRLAAAFCPRLRPSLAVAVALLALLFSPCRSPLPLTLPLPLPFFSCSLLMT